MNEIVFQDRHKEYGAYKIRKAYSANVLIGFTITTFIASLPYFFSTKSVHNKSQKVKQITFEPIADLPLLPTAAPQKSKSPPTSKPGKSPKHTASMLMDNEIEPQQQTESIGTEEGNGNDQPAKTPEGIDGSAGSDGDKAGTAKLFIQVYYVKIPSDKKMAELIFNEEVEKDMKQGVKTYVAKYLSYSNPQIQRLAVTQGYVHVSHRQSFVMINDSVAINLAQIESIDEKQAVLKNGETIKIAKRLRNHLKERLQAYMNIAGDSAAVVAEYENKKHFSYKAVDATLKPEEREITFNASTDALTYGDTELGSTGTGLQKAIANRQIASAVDETRKNIEEAIVKQKLAEEKALQMFRPYGQPDASIAIDHTMINFSSIGQVLQGRVPGVQVVLDKIQIRGATRLELDEDDNSIVVEPLYMVNGLPSTKEVFAALPISVISVIDVLKSPDNTALYGSHSSGGVINVITKIPPVISSTAEELKKAEKLEESIEKSRHLKEARGRKMKREKFLEEWIRDYSKDNLYPQHLLTAKAYTPKRCACSQHYCNGWRMEFDKQKFNSWRKNRTTPKN